MDKDIENILLGELIETFGTQIKDLNAFKSKLNILSKAFIETVKLIEFKGNLANNSDHDLQLRTLPALGASMKRLSNFDSDETMGKITELLATIFNRCNTKEKSNCH